MFRFVPQRAVLQSRLFPAFMRFDRFGFYALTAAVLFFAIYPLLFFGSASNRWLLGADKSIPLNDSLTIILSLEAFSLVWLWLEMPRRRKAENALKKMHTVQRAISNASGRIVSLSSDDLERGLQTELCAIREMLGVDRASWFQRSKDGSQYTCVQASSSEQLTALNEFWLSEIVWINDAISRGAPVRLRRLKDLPAEAEADRAILKRCGVKALALIPSNSGASGMNVLVLTSFGKEIDWDEEVIAQLSVLVSVFASSHAKKVALDAGYVSELKFRRLFDDSPIGIALLSPDGQVHMANAAMGKLLGRDNGELTFRNILDFTYSEDIPQAWLHMQEVIAGVREITQTEKRLLRKDGSVIWGRITISLVGAENEGAPFLLGMIEDVTETNSAREQLERSRKMLSLALEASRTTAWEFDAVSGMVSWLDRSKLRDADDFAPARDLFSNVLLHVVMEDREKLRNCAKTMLRTGGTFSTEFRMIAKDSSVRWMLGKGELLTKDGESVPRIVGVTVDVSEVKRAQFQLQQLTKRLMEAQEEERKRISRELHDDIGQRVALLALELDLIQQQLGNQDKLRERVAQMQASASELGTDLHHLSHALHSSKLKHLGLEAALRELCHRMSNKQQLTIELTCGEQTKIVSEDEALVLYRVAQEALTNVLRHSQATQATLTLEYSDKDSCATLVISDNGRGFDLDERTDGIGLVGMRERLRSLHGDFHISSAPDCGTQIRASIPLGKIEDTLRPGRHAKATSA
ncbi:MAG TPA: PAS domain S-box protein [Candidatus Acidoferrum sp.]|jgi:PAS domain S-box-containing protein